MTSPDRTALRSAYLYLVCLITLVMVIFAAVNLVRNVVELAYPDRSTYALEPFYGPEGEQELSTDERRRREEAFQDSQRRQAVLGIVGSATMLLIAGPAYLYHWRRVQSELRREADADQGVASGHA
jgi:hypothetical protein